jgi:NAD+ kinase
VIVALGGDGMLLHSIHEHRARAVPIYGMNRGTVGFLMNAYGAEDLEARIGAAKEETLVPLRMKALGVDGKEEEAIAFNEVSVIRYSGQSANLRILVDGRERIPKLICDGVLVSTPAGSTAYNLSAHGPIVPLGANLLAMTPVSPFRPRRWRGALLPEQSEIVIENLDPGKRPIGVSADSHEMRDVRSITIAEDRSCAVTVLFDPDHSLEERIFSEQFAHG